jgi:ceramide glucosyltransferase
MLWRRDILERCGGIEALGAEIAEDAASTKLVRRAGLSVNLVDAPFSQPLGARLFRDVWARQLRWARLRRATFAPYFALELLTSSVFVIAAAAVAGEACGLSSWMTAGLAALIWYGAEGALALVAGWGLGWGSPIAWIARDLLLPWLWVSGWSGGRVEWRGNAISVDDRPLREASPR